MKEKIRKKSFWLSVCGAVVLILQLLGVKVDVPYVNEVACAVCALLVILGLIRDDSDLTALDESDKDGKIEETDNNNDQ